MESSELSEEIFDNSIGNFNQANKKFVFFINCINEIREFHARNGMKLNAFGN